MAWTFLRTRQLWLLELVCGWANTAEHSNLRTRPLKSPLMTYLALGQLFTSELSFHICKSGATRTSSGCYIVLLILWRQAHSQAWPSPGPQWAVTSQLSLSAGRGGFKQKTFACSCVRFLGVSKFPTLHAFHLLHPNAVPLRAGPLPWTAPDSISVTRALPRILSWERTKAKHQDTKSYQWPCECCQALVPTLTARVEGGQLWHKHRFPLTWLSWLCVLLNKFRFGKDYFWYTAT